MGGVSETFCELVVTEPRKRPVLSKNLLIGIKDYFNAFKKWRLLFYLSHAEMTRTYKRTVIGPFWAALSMGIFIASMGILFSLLWHTQISTYLPLFASGYIVWIFFSTVVTGASTAFTSMEAYIKQIDLPYSFYAFSLICRNVIIFAHQLLVFVVIALIFHIPVTLNTFLFVPGFVLLLLNCSWITILLGILCTRFRDIQQIVVNLLQIAMFVTPIFWSESQLGHSKVAFVCIQLNPLYHLISVVRYPLMGQATHLSSWLVDIGLLIFGWVITMRVLGQKYHKLVYWL